MSLPGVRVLVPATTANLGPGFDCLALSLDLWNETTFRLEGEGLTISVEGEGQGSLPEDESNLVAQAAMECFRRSGVPPPPGLSIHCRNRIPLGSGLGSSGSALLAGLLGVNALLGERQSRAEILKLAIEIEGHPDNAAAALWGGLVVVLASADGWLARRYDLPPLGVTVALPAVDLPTRTARAALPQMVPLADAVYNLGRAVLVVESIRDGNLELLGQVMDDRLHQPYRLGLIPGARAALAAARRAGAAAAALSGAGPSIIAFGGEQASVGEAMQSAFSEENITSRLFQLQATSLGAQVEILSG